MTTSTQRKSNDRENHPHTQKLLLHPSGGGRDGSVLPCERDGRSLANAEGHRSQLHAQNSTGEVSPGGAGRGSSNPQLHRLEVAISAADEVAANIEYLEKAAYSSGVAETYAALVPEKPAISSPAYQLPPIPQDADEFASRYIKTYVLSESLHRHLAIAWLSGRVSKAEEHRSDFLQFANAAYVGGGK